MTDTYKRDGYLHVHEAFPPADLEPLRDCIQREVGNYANEMHNMGKINSPYENLPFGQRLAALHRENEIRLRSWNAPVFGPELHALIHHPGIADALEPHLGPNISFKRRLPSTPQNARQRVNSFPSPSGQPVLRQTVTTRPHYHSLDPPSSTSTNKTAVST